MIINKKKLKEQKKVSIPLILVFLIIFYNKETFPSIYQSSLVDTIFILISIIGGFFFTTIFSKEIRINYQALMTTLYFYIVIFATMLINSDFSGGYFVVLLSLLLGFMLIHLVPLSKFTKIYVDIIVLLGVYSVLVLLFKPIIQNMPVIIFPRFNNIANVPIINARLSYIVDANNYYRNFGIFREPGVYQVFLNIALMFELFYKNEQPEPVKLIILYITIISTFSTPGYVASLILTCAYILFEGKTLKISGMRKNKKQILMILGVILIASLTLYYLNDSFNKNFSDAFDKLGSQGSSYSIRTIGLISNIMVWIKRPIFGYGIVNGLEKEARVMIQDNLNAVSISSFDNTSTIGALLVSFGLIFTILYVYLIYNLVKQSSQNRVVEILIMLAIMITINTQLLIYNELLYVILYYGLTNKNENISFTRKEE